MKLGSLLLGILVIPEWSVAAWDVHPDCLRRDLSTEAIPEEPSVTPPRMLRGSEYDRFLADGSLVFQMRMHWEEGFCWQEEIRERFWCWQCEGSSCNYNDEMIIMECSRSSRQKFVFESVSGGVKLKPNNDKSLCLERIGSGSSHRLRNCRNTNSQIYVGFQTSGRFELHPYGSENRCLTQEHHPKPYEQIFNTDCRTPRRDKTNWWIVYNPSGGGGNSNPPPPPPPSRPNPPSTPGASQLDFRGSSYCNGQCGLCQGDCDNDDDCIDGFVCFQRDENEEVPGCNGGGNDRSRSDYCIPENPSPTRAPVPSPTRAPVPPPVASPTRAPVPSPSSSPVVETGPPLRARGGDYCSSRNKCDVCVGDCDDDEDCRGNLVCFQRGPREPVPGCSGGTQDNSRTDYCVEP